ncbi:hypothetical protein PF010_g8654 [Phytophthora fragariae]|uniref:FYVE-type domain-containing protein n=4 Tax=Phytophthora TaxID=4783 RepID=A0A6A3R055_9STRA|nr:hypothetical protein PF003_g13122 [Phytophthora fragariae]KAE9035591.1 hypothetical protein PR002_g7495 [Phytophthora rubi]KAE8928459.1 hypothetical protein PF009_g21399 [Phytophthora fragariae]KAE8988282.1 hypothetical protein PF011_g19231 [Phytophthora fragariae]KAE9040315.1 hypothetical protein PR001_g7125 [Phytophthora rubi]
MTKGGFFETPFQPISLSLADTKGLRDVMKTIVDASFERYVNFSGVDPNLWKPLKTKDGIQIYSSRTKQHRSPQPPYGGSVDDDSELQSLLCMGWTSCSLDDMMQNVVDSTTAVSTSRTSFTNDFSDSAMLALVEDPTVLEPYTSVVVKWMELDVRRRSIGLVKNRDYIYVEMTGAKTLPNGEQVGYHVMHSVGIPQAHSLPGKVRAKLSVCSFFRQVDKSSVSIYSMGMMDPMSDRVRQVVVPRFLKMLLSTYKCSQESKVKKLTQSLGKRYSELDNRRPSSSDNNNCITCTKRTWRLAKLSSRNNTCMICCGYICGSCKIEKKLKVPTPDMKVATKKVAFCFSCLTDVMTANESEFSFVEDSNDGPEIPRSTYHSVWSTRLPRWSLTKNDEPLADFSSTR